MRFAHTDLENSLEWTDSVRINELVIESPIFMRKVLSSLANQDCDSSVKFINEGEALTLSRDIDVIYNPLKLDFNNRRAMATLLKMLVKRSLSEDFYMETNEFKSRVVQYLDKIIDFEDFIFEVSAGDFAIDDIAKAINVHIVDDEDDFVELLTNYMSMMVELVDIKLFIFLNLRAILADNELERLQNNLKNHQLNALLIENRLLRNISDCGRIVVDADLCEIG